MNCPIHFASLILVVTWVELVAVHLEVHRVVVLGGRLVQVAMH
jgi:hypothetical protein